MVVTLHSSFIGFFETTVVDSNLNPPHRNSIVCPPPLTCNDTAGRASIFDSSSSVRLVIDSCYCDSGPNSLWPIRLLRGSPTHHLQHHQFCRGFSEQLVTWAKTSYAQPAVRVEPSISLLFLSYDIHTSTNGWMTDWVLMHFSSSFQTLALSRSIWWVTRVQCPMTIKRVIE